MEVVDATSIIAGLAHSGLQIRKRIAGRGQAGLLSSSSPACPQNAHHNSLSVFAGRIGESRNLGSTPRISGHQPLKELGDDCDCDCDCEPILQACAQYEP